MQCGNRLAQTGFPSTFALRSSPSQKLDARHCFSWRLFRAPEDIGAKSPLKADLPCDLGREDLPFTLHPAPPPIWRRILGVRRRSFSRPRPRRNEKTIPGTALALLFSPSNSRDSPLRREDEILGSSARPIRVYPSFGITGSMGDRACWHDAGGPGRAPPLLVPTTSPLSRGKKWKSQTSTPSVSRLKITSTRVPGSL